MILLHRSATTTPQRNKSKPNHQEPEWLLQSRYRNRSFVISKHKHKNIVVKDTSPDRLRALKHICRRMKHGLLMLAWLHWRELDRKLVAVQRLLFYLRRAFWRYYFYLWKQKVSQCRKASLLLNILKRMMSQWLYRAWNTWLLFLKQQHKEELIKNTLHRLTNISRIGLLIHAWSIWSRPGPSMIKFIRRKIGHCNCVYELGDKQHHCGFEKHLVNRVKLLRFEVDNSRDSQYKTKLHVKPLVKASFNSLQGSMRNTPTQYQQKRQQSHW
jgi:hypothetical protein